MKEAKDSNKEFKKSFDEAATHFERFYIYFPHQTRESLMGHAKTIPKPAWGYYNSLFHKEGGYCYYMIRMASSAKKINTQHLKGESEAEIVTVIQHEVDKLLHLNCHNFIPEFIRWLKNEFPKMVDESNRDQDFDKLVTLNKLQTRIQKIIKRKKLDPNVRLTWESGDAEYA